MTAFTRLLGSELLDKSKTVPTTSLEGKVVGLYFSAHWCGPCRQFTPVLSGIYQELQKEKKPFEIVFISSDKEEKSFKEYFASMPWKALPFGSELANSLAQSFQIKGIPSLILLDPEGNTLSTQGRELIQRLGAKGFPYGAKIKEEELKKKKEDKAKEQALLAPKQAALGKEPDDGTGVVTVQINTPSGLKSQRRFYDSQTISEVEKFVAAFDISLASTPFCVRTNFPRPGVVFQESNQPLSEAFPDTKRINLFVQKGVSSKPGKARPKSTTTPTPTPTTTPAPTGLDRITNVRIVKPAAPASAEWECQVCTLINESSTQACTACGSPRLA